MAQTLIPARHPYVPERRLPLEMEQQDLQFQRGLWTVERGVRYPLPIDHIKRKTEWQGRQVWVRDEQGTHRKGVKFQPTRFHLQRKILETLRDKVHRDIPYWYYLATLGHDLHVSTWGDLFGRHFHAGWADPITGEIGQPLDPSFETLFKTHWVDHECDLSTTLKAGLSAKLKAGLSQCPRELGITLEMLRGLRGFTEELGWLSGSKVTDAFVSEEIDELVSATGTEYADFDFHEVGTSTQAESNNDTALIATSGIARATGSPTDSDPIYQNVGTVTADATESWEEHGLFNNSTSAALMDRSLTGGQSVNSSDQVQYTYQLTKNPEA